MKRKKKDKNKKEIQFEILLLFIIFAVALSIAVGAVLYKSLSNYLSDEYSERLTDTAKLVAGLVDADDIDDYLANGKSDEYEKSYKILKNIKEVNDLKYLYIFRVVNDGKYMQYIFDIETEENSPEYIYELGELCEISKDEAYQELLSKVLVSQKEEKIDVYDNEFGWMFMDISPLYDSDGNITAYVGMDISAQEMAYRIYFLTSMVFSVMFIFIAVFFVILWFAIKKKVIDYITKISARMQSVVEGGNVLNIEKLNINTNDEMQTMSEGFNKMLLDIRKYVDEVQKATAEKERVATELNVAKNIQGSMLPCVFPPFPYQDKIDIFAKMIPAREVGGDFYDFFFTDDKHIAIVIADVCNKGVPAALFMVIAKTLLKNQAQMKLSPKEIMETTNVKLFESNNTNMFLTAFIGIYDLETGEFKFCNAGHNPPLIKRKGGKFKRITKTANFVLAAFDTTKYKEESIKLEKGDCILMYTDGVTEAQNDKGKLYTEKRLIDFVDSIELNGLSTVKMVNSIKADVDKFVGKADQFDDITILAFEIMD